MTIGLLSDAHGNLESFERALAVLARAGVDDVYFLGDAVGYLPGSAVADAIVERGLVSVLGNHEAMLLADHREKDDVYQLGTTRDTMPAATLAGIRAWPPHLDLELACGRVRLLHGSPSDPVFGYVYPDSDLTAFEVGHLDVICMGNTHRPFVRDAPGARFVNIGSCGLPRDCGDLGAVGVLDERTGEAVVIRFDIADTTARALDRVGEVAPEVLAVFERRTPGGCFGEVRDHGQ